jgi:hypothetical protein
MTTSIFCRSYFLIVLAASLVISYGQQLPNDFAASESGGAGFEKSGQSSAGDKADTAPIERKLIKSGELRFRTRNIPETYAFILGLADSLDGYVSDEQMNSHTGSTEQSLTLRVPAKNLDVLINAITGFAGELDYRNIGVQDVTLEYVDVESRIKTKKELETRYLELLEQAQKVEEILSIERELGTLRADIESMEGRLNYLKNQVDLSTLRVSFYTLAGEGPGYGSKVVRSLHGGWELMQELSLTLVYAWPLWIAAGLVILLLRWRKARRPNQ